MVQFWAPSRRTQGIVGSSSLIVHRTALSGTDLLGLFVHLLYVPFTLTFLPPCGFLVGPVESSQRDTPRKRLLHSS